MIAPKSAVGLREVAHPDEADYGTVLSVDGFTARVRWHVAQVTYTERLTDLRLLGDEEQRAYSEAMVADLRGRV